MVWKSNDFDRYNQERIEELKQELRRLADRAPATDRQVQRQDEPAYAGAAI